MHAATGYQKGLIHAAPGSRNYFFYFLFLETQEASFKKTPQAIKKASYTPPQAKKYFLFLYF
jgi:hypothetical protein